MSNLDMTEAIRMLAGDRGISVDSLLQVLVEALATAYKKRQGAAEEVIVGINPENMDITFTAYDVDQRARRHAKERRTRPYCCANFPSGDEPAHS